METTTVAGRVLWVDNVGLNIEMHRMLHPVIARCVLNGESLPEDYADLFTLEIVTVDGLARGILRAA